MTDPISTPAEMREAAALLATSFLVGDPQNGVPLRNPMAHEIAAAIRALPVAEPAPLAVRVKPLVWEETHDDRGDGSSEHNGCYEASTALGVYEIGMGFGSDAYYWSVCDPNYNEIGSFEDPSYAQAAAEADHAARILSQIDAVSVAQVRAEALEALLADDEMCLRLAEGYDREYAAQRGEPSPHTMGEDGYSEWAADRIACAKEGLRAIRAMKGAMR